MFEVVPEIFRSDILVSYVLVKMHKYRINIGVC